MQATANRQLDKAIENFARVAMNQAVACQNGDRLPTGSADAYDAVRKAIIDAARLSRRASVHRARLGI